MRNQTLLKILPACEYPAEFLAARLLGKKGVLFRNWEFLISSSDARESLQNTVFYPYLKKYAPPGIWRFLHNEYQWVYQRMNDQLRADFSSYFVYHEINTLLACLRYRCRNNSSEQVQDLLHNSLLHSDIQAFLITISDLATMLHALEIRLCGYAEHFTGLYETFEKNGMAALEAFLRDGFFAAIFSQKKPALLQAFFQYIVDFHNCISVAKNLRWQIETEPCLVAGGTVPAERFKRAYFRRDLLPLLQYMRLRDADNAGASIQKLETALLRSITDRLKRWSLQGTVEANILYYLWEQYRYTRNISMVLNTVILEDEAVRESLIA